MSKQYRLTIGISVYKLDELSYIIRNLKYFTELEMSLSIHVMCNPDIFTEALNVLKSAGADIIQLEKGIPDFFTPYDEGSYRHAGNLNILSQKYSDTDQIILCDPDIVFIKNSFFTDLKKLHDDGQAVIGLEWDLTIPSKWRDFPAPHFLSIDPSKINLHLVEFRPFLESSYSKRVRAKKLKNVIGFIKKARIKLIPGILNFFLLYSKKNLSSDTGYFFRKLSKRRKLSVHLINNSVNYYNYMTLMRVIENIPKPIRKLTILSGLVPVVEKYTSCLIDKYFYLYKATRPEEMLLNDDICAIHFRSVRVLNQQSKDCLNLNLEFLDKIEVCSLKTNSYIRNPKFQKIS